MPEVSIKSVGPSSINIGWTFPPVELKNHFHFFKLLMFNNEVKKETVVNPDQYFSYAFTDLHSASTYNFQASRKVYFVDSQAFVSGNFSSIPPSAELFMYAVYCIRFPSLHFLRPWEYSNRYVSS